MIETAIVMKAIEAGVTVGQKLHQILIDGTHERSLLLPVGNLLGRVEDADAIFYFSDHPELTAPGGPYRGFNRKEKIQAYQTLIQVSAEVGEVGDDLKRAREIVSSLSEFEQLKKGFGAQSPLKRIMGTIVEIGIDYLIANPDAIRGDSAPKKILKAFIANLDEIEFAEGTKTEIVENLLLVSLRTIDANVSLIDDGERLRALLGGIAKSLVEDVESIQSQGLRLQREDLVRRISSSAVRGGVSAFVEDIALYLPDELTARTLVHSTLNRVLGGIRGKEGIFTSKSLELIVRGALSAVGENTASLPDDKFVEEFIRASTKAMTDTRGRKLFPKETVGAVVLAGLETLRDHAETLIDPANPEKQLLADSVSAIVRSMATSLAGGGAARDLLTPSQRVELSRVVFTEVAQHPEHLLGAVDDDVSKSALTQIIGSVARALGRNPSRLVTGEGFIELVKLAIEVAVQNADKLLDLDTSNTRTNLLFTAMQQIVESVLGGRDQRGLVGRDVFLDIVERVLPVVSANLEPFLGDRPKAVRDTVAKALDLSSDALQNRVNGTNLPVLIEQLLTQVFWGELNLSEDTAMLNAAVGVLRAA